MRKPRIVIAVALLLGLTPLLVAQSSWEGSAVVARFGEFPPGGLYAASNSFPLNSMVDVTNLETGRSARLIIANRLEDSGVFLLLSETAADELGVSRGGSASVRAEPVQLPGLTAVEPNQDLPFSPDPDVNPAASLGDPNTPIINPAAIRAAEAAEAAEAPADEAAPVDEAPAPAESTAPSQEIAEEPSITPVPTEPVEQPEQVGQVEQVAPAQEAPADTGTTPEPSIAAVVTVEPEGEPEAPTEEPVVEQPQLEDLESPDRIADAPAGDDVIGVAPEPPADTQALAPVDSAVRPVALDRPESPSPNVYPAPRPPLVVELDTPPDPQRDEAVEIVAPVDVVPPRVVEEAEEPATPVVDPLEERLAAIEQFMDDQRVSSAPLEAEPLETLGIGEPSDPAAAAAPLPEVDPAVAFDADVSDPLPPMPNPVRLSVILPEVVDTTSPEVADDIPAQPEERFTEIALPLAPVSDEAVDIAVESPEPPVLGENEIALPLVPLREDVEVSERLAEGEQDEEEIDVALAEPSPDREEIVQEVEPAAEPEGEPEPEPDPGAEALRPTLIPEDAVISLEPADYRSPEPPQPTAEDLPAETAGPEGDVDARLAEAPTPEDAAIAAVEPVEERAAPPAPVAPADVPTEPTTPSMAPAVTIAPGEDGTWAAANLPLVADLDRDSVYVQVAAYANPRSAKQTIERLGDRYPVAVLSDGGEREFYRVFVGPLSEDEKGSALFQIRNRGFRDAFLRQP